MPVDAVSADETRRGVEQGGLRPVQPGLDERPLVVLVVRSALGVPPLLELGQVLLQFRLDRLALLLLPGDCLQVALKDLGQLGILLGGAGVQELQLEIGYAGRLQQRLCLVQVEGIRPALIGFVAAATSLSIAFVGVAILLLVVARSSNVAMR